MPEGSLPRDSFKIIFQVHLPEFHQAKVFGQTAQKGYVNYLGRLLQKKLFQNDFAIGTGDLSQLFQAALVFAFPAQNGGQDRFVSVANPIQALEVLLPLPAPTDGGKRQTESGQKDRNQDSGNNLRDVLKQI